MEPGGDQDEDQDHGPGSDIELEDESFDDVCPIPQALQDLPENDDDDDDAGPHTRIPAFNEKSYVRFGYLKAVLDNVFGKLNWKEVASALRSNLTILRLAGCLPTSPKPVITLESARKRLGIDADVHIIEYVMCPVCWKLYLPGDAEELEGLDCQVAGCAGILFERTGRGREPKLICPQVSLIGSLRRMFLRPGFAKAVERKAGAVPGRNTAEDFVMEDISHGEMWYRSTTATKRQQGGDGTIRDIGINGGLGVPLHERKYGLQLTINLDWYPVRFGLVGRPHSTGPIFVAINNLPRDERFLQMNVICAAITPGPHEPTLEQLNNVLEPVETDLQQLKQGKVDLCPLVCICTYCLEGVCMEIHERDADMVYADALCTNCDTPASRKCLGAAGHTHDVNPCPYCKATIVDIDKLEGYTTESAPKEDFAVLKHAYRYKEADTEDQQTLLDYNGFRWARLNLLSSWLPTSKNLIDFMHNIYLGTVNHFFMVLIFRSYMLSGRGGKNSEKARFEATINSIQWPSHITRLPKNLGENQSLKKADEWRNLLTVAPVVLWCTWKDLDDEIPPSSPPIPANATSKPTHNREYRKIYTAMLKLCAGVRILSSRRISMAEVRIGHDFLMDYCRALKQFKVHTTINHHMMRYYLKFIPLFGPIYGWWLFPFERFNGMLKKVKHNGHKEGRMELTLLCHWVMAHLMHEYSLSLPDTCEDECDLIMETIQDQGRKSKGTIMSELAASGKIRVSNSGVIVGNLTKLRWKIRKVSVIHYLPPRKITQLGYSK
ncbi:hypothetical protein BDN72DRAFT_946510 [Pluteus cervinus]|uniref:Uncharacterized protein n=1 Tax=Pluteus cervinus TaxID=181527 RepID=A0ACD3A0S2_9AGAR|nr:hypothetical protein BDN72DRAFT_946510 [Pluteus cervinus]